MNTKRAVEMSDDELAAELERTGVEWDNYRDKLEGKSGSPGEWLFDRMDEIETEQRRRVRARQEPSS